MYTHKMIFWDILIFQNHLKSSLLCFRCPVGEKEYKMKVTPDLGGFMMSFRLIEKDCKTLERIAEYRMLTVSQIAAMFHKSRLSHFC